MKVQELIEELQKFNPDADAWIDAGDNFFPVHEVNLGIHSEVMIG